jgi:hypothetical protein
MIVWGGQPRLDDAPLATGARYQPSGTTVVPNISVGDARIVEGQASSWRTLIAFPITLSSPLSTDVVVDYATSDGTARAGEDYIARAGRLTVPAGQTERLLLVLGTQGWHREGIAFRALGASGSYAESDTIPFWRLYDTATAQHLYTTDSREVLVLADLPHWKYEGVFAYVLAHAGTSGAGSTPLERLAFKLAPYHLWSIAPSKCTPSRSAPGRTRAVQDSCCSREAPARRCAPTRGIAGAQRV